MSMKRSASVVLVMMAAAALVGCEEPKSDVITFKDLDQCKASPDISDEQCDAAYKQAQKQAENEVRYKTASDCESEFGVNGCRYVPSSNGGESAWTPLMTGFLMTYAAASVVDALSDVNESAYYREKRKALEEDRLRKKKEDERNYSGGAVYAGGSSTTASRPLYTKKSSPHEYYSGNNTRVATTSDVGKVKKLSTQTVSAKPKPVTLNRGQFSSTGRSSGG